jgi:adenylylsulfate kinase-like enzyme
MTFAVWLTGLPACGKSAIARDLLRLLHDRAVDAAVLESDVMRTQLTPFPRYDEADRDFFYGALAEIGLALVRRGRPVIFDATANRRRYRDAVRSAIDRFCEVHVDTPLEVCRSRDPKGLYRSGRLADLAYEPPLRAELVLSGARLTAAQAAEEITSYLRTRRWL